MPVTEFDNLLRDQFEQGSFEYKPASWERLSTQLPVKKKPFIKRFFWLPIAAAAAAIAGFIALPSLQHKDGAPIMAHKTIIRHTIKGNSSPLNPASAVTNPASAATTAIATTATPASGNLIAKTSFSFHKAAPITTKLHATSVPAGAVNPIASNTAITPTPVILPAENENVVVAKSATQPVVKPFQQRSGFSGGRSSSPTFIIDGAQMDGAQFASSGQAFNASSLSIAGGYKYGTANMGYMVGLNGRKRLGEKVFVEGDLAFANSRNAQVTTEATNESFDQVKTLAGTNAVAARAVSRGDRVANMYYLQLTPTVGYQVFRTMSVGAGADIQRMFQGNESTVYIMDGDDVKVIPQLDCGVVGKVEYSLTKTFKAGIQYRQGVNTLVAQDKGYMNRSYFQVQLKLGILGH